MPDIVSEKSQNRKCEIELEKVPAVDSKRGLWWMITTVGILPSRQKRTVHIMPHFASLPIETLVFYRFSLRLT